MGGGDIRSVGDVLAELATAREAIAERLATLDLLTEEASKRVYHGESADRTVVADVDGNGRLLALAVDPAALRTGHPERVGSEVVAAVTGARAFAAQERAQQVRETLGTGRRPRAGGESHVPGGDRGARGSTQTPARGGSQGRR